MFSAVLLIVAAVALLVGMPLFAIVGLAAFAGMKIYTKRKVERTFKALSDLDK